MSEPFDPFGDFESPLENAFSEVDSIAEEDTEPETEEEKELAKVPHEMVSSVIRSFFITEVSGTLAQAFPLLQDIWYDYANDCPHLTLKLQTPFVAVTDFQLAEIRKELANLGEMLTPIFSSQVAISVEVPSGH